MVLIPVLCPHCQSDQVIKGGNHQSRKTTLSLPKYRLLPLFFCTQPHLLRSPTRDQRPNHRYGAQW